MCIYISGQCGVVWSCRHHIPASLNFQTWLGFCDRNEVETGPAFQSRSADCNQYRPILRCDQQFDLRNGGAVFFPRAISNEQVFQSWPCMQRRNTTKVYQHVPTLKLEKYLGIGMLNVFFFWGQPVSVQQTAAMQYSQLALVLSCLVASFLAFWGIVQTNPTRKHGRILASPRLWGCGRWWRLRFSGDLFRIGAGSVKCKFLQLLSALFAYDLSRAGFQTWTSAVSGAAMLHHGCLYHGLRSHCVDVPCNQQLEKIWLSTLKTLAVE